MYTPSEDLPSKARARFNVNTSPGSFGRGGVPMKNNSAPAGNCDWFVAGTMSSSAFSVRICASSKTSMSI